MKTFLSVLGFFALVAALCSCASPGAAREEISGIYSGVIPAADCPGICVVAILNSETGRYKMTYQYIDRDVDLFTDTGTFDWNRETGLVTLDSGELPRYYRAGERVLTQLDMTGKEITGPLARNYELRKAMVSDD